METIFDTKRKARKEHICNYCGLTIQKGEVYDRQVNKDGGDIYTFISHQSCTELGIEIIDRYNVDDGLTEYDFVSSVEDEFQNIFIDNLSDKELTSSQKWDIFLKDETPFEEKLKIVKQHFDIK